MSELPADEEAVVAAAEADRSIEEDEAEEDFAEMSRNDLVEQLFEMKHSMQQAAEFGSAMMAELNAVEQLKADNAALVEEKDTVASQLEESEWRVGELEQVRGAVPISPHPTRGGEPVPLRRV